MCICGNKDYTVGYHMKNGLPYLTIMCTTILCECLHSQDEEKRDFVCALANDGDPPFMPGRYDLASHLLGCGQIIRRINLITNK